MKRKKLIEDLAQNSTDGVELKTLIAMYYDTALEANNALAKFKKENNYE